MSFLNLTLKYTETLSQKLMNVVFFNVFSFFPSLKMDLPISVLFIILMGFLSIFGLNFFPLRKFLISIKNLFISEKKDQTEGLSKFASIASAISASTGLGFLAGTGVAVVIFGPGLVFYIPFAAVFASCIRFIEVFLVHKYRQKDENGLFYGNPEIYIKKILEKRNFKKLGTYLAFLYCLIIICTSFFGPAMLEINQISKSVTSFHIFKDQEIIISIISVAFVSIIIFGGIKRISQFFLKSIPILIGLFFAISIFTIFKNKAHILNAFSVIFEDAFKPKTQIGGGILVLIFTALKRIMIGTEAGFGTAASMHAPSKEVNSIKEAISSMISPFIGSISVAFLVGFLVVLTDAYKIVDAKGGITVLAYALSTGHPSFKFILTIITIFMALNVMIGWSYYGVINIQNLLGKWAKYPYLFIYILAGFLGGTLNDFQVILNLADATLFLVPFIHFFVIFLDFKEIKYEVKKYEQN